MTIIKSRVELIEAIKNGLEPEYLLFYGHTVSDHSVITKTCFSQWYPVAFKLDGVTYKTAEHYMMAEKARLFKDEEIEQKIIQSSDPKEAKKLGRAVRNYDDESWKRHRFEAVIKGNIAKFEQNKKLGTFLKNTEDKIIVEAAPRDRIWGIGMGQNNPDATNPEKWRGQNLLGFALMQARKELKN